MKTEKMLKIFNEAITIFFQNERENILSGVTERNLCGRLSYYIQSLLERNDFNEYFADPEYNRKQNGEIKTILDGEMRVIPIQCDIVVHSRGKNIQHDNLIAIEMKKSNRPQFEKDSDKDRLRALTRDSFDNVWSNDGKTYPEHVCGYVLGVFVDIDINNRQCLCEFFEKGEKFSESAINFT